MDQYSKKCIIALSILLCRCHGWASKKADFERMVVDKNSNELQVKIVEKVQVLKNFRSTMGFHI